jgi:hypothetical protein
MSVIGIFHQLTRVHGLKVRQIGTFVIDHPSKHLDLKVLIDRPSGESKVSYKIQIVDEYSFGQWFDCSLRFATEAEAEQYSQRFPNAGWYGIQHLRVSASDEPANARWTEQGLCDKWGQPFYRPSPPPTPEEVQVEADRLRTAWAAIVERLGR